MKTALVIFILTACQFTTEPLRASDFLAFERNFAQSLSSEKDATILIGFRTFLIDDSAKQFYRNLISERGEELSKNNHVFSDDLSFFRQYFPMSTAIVEYNGNTYTANYKGVILKQNLKETNKIKIIGRKKSEFVQGTADDIIDEDRIIFRKPLIQENRSHVENDSINRRICVFDCGNFSFGM